MPELDESRWTATVGEEEVAYTELVKDGSPTFNIENDGSTLTRQILVLWDDLNDAKNAFLGYPVVAGTGGVQRWVSRATPDYAGIFLNSKGHPYLFATKLSGQGYGMPPDADDGIHDQSTDFPIYRYAKLEVTYETLTYDILSDQEMINRDFTDDDNNPDESTLARYVTIEFRPNVDYLALRVF